MWHENVNFDGSFGWSRKEYKMKRLAYLKHCRANSLVNKASIKWRHRNKKKLWLQNVIEILFVNSLTRYLSWLRNYVLECLSLTIDCVVSTIMHASLLISFISSVQTSQSINNSILISQYSHGTIQCLSARGVSARHCQVYYRVCVCYISASCYPQVASFSAHMFWPVREEQTQTVPSRWVLLVNPQYNGIIPICVAQYVSGLQFN